MKRAHKVFFAIPFDSATRNLYESVAQAIRKQHPTIRTVIGNYQVGPSPEYSDIATFKAQNRELTSQFVAQIRDADVVIADLTHNNPNVHVELGIALTQNKNVLRVTGRSVSELGFDIRNLDVYRYEHESQLADKIKTYLDTFFKIKQLQISEEFGELYCKEPMVPMQLKGHPKESGSPDVHGFDIQSNCPQDFILRDGSVRVEFEFRLCKAQDAWFGVFIRAGTSALLGSHLVYVRRNGSIEIVVYPGPRERKHLTNVPLIDGRQMLVIDFENNHLDLRMGDSRAQTDELSHLAPGRVLQAAWDADVTVHSAEMICRDTIEWA